MGGGGGGGEEGVPMFSSFCQCHRSSELSVVTMYGHVKLAHTSDLGNCLIFDSPMDHVTAVGLRKLFQE